MSKKKRKVRLLNRSISYSLLKTFLECRESCRIQYFEGLRPYKDSEALMFGSAFHACNSKLIGPNPRPQAVTRVCNRYKQSHLKKVGRYYSAQARDMFDKAIAELKPVLYGYQQKWRKEAKRIEWISREEPFWIDYEVPHDGYVFILTLHGYLDGSYRYVNQQRPWVFESKCKKKWDEDDIRDILPFDLQTMLYVYALKQTTGKMPAGICYDVIRRPQLRYIPGKQDLADHAQRIAEDIQSRPKFYYQRYYENTLKASDVNLWLHRYFDNLCRTFITWVLGFHPCWEQYISPAKSPRRLHSQLASPYENPHHFANSNALITQWGRSDMYDAVARNDLTGLRRSPKAITHVILKEES